MLFAFINCIFAMEYIPQNGDIILQTSQSQQSQFIQIATQSPYSHVGIVYIKDGSPMVYEANGKTQLTPLNTFIDRGYKDQYTVARLKTELTDAQLMNMKVAGEKYQNTTYDIYFEWTDSKMYCSELVWKIYEQGAGIELIEPKEFQDYNIDDPTVAYHINKRWGSRFNPKEKVVAPSDLLLSDQLMIVYDNLQ